MYGIPKTHFDLSEYFEFLQIPECAGMGIRNYPSFDIPPNELGCRIYWNQENRYWLAASIQKAEKRLCNDIYLGFPIRREYYNDQQRTFETPTYLGKYLRGMGVETETYLDTPVLSLSVGGVINDPVEFTVAVTFTDPDELIIKYPSNYYDSHCTDYLIRPSCVQIASGVATVQIPRCRLLEPAYFVNYKNDNERPDYQDDDNFLVEVDVYRNYLNQTTGNNLIWFPTGGCSALCDSTSTAPCSDTRQLACGYIRSQRDGYVDFRPSTYTASTDSWVNSTPLVCRKPDALELNYMRGFYDRYDVMSMELQRALVALAHNNLPQTYCACDVQTLYWQNDNKPFEPPVRMKWGKSTHGVYEASMIIDQFDKDKNSHKGGML